MNQRPLIVVSLEGLATSALSCYGSAWNSTPALDAIAASGCVWDRWTANHDHSVDMLRQWMLPSSSPSWLQAWQAHGPVELLTDDRRLIDLHFGNRFDNQTLIPSDSPEPNETAALEIDETQFGRLAAAAIDRDARGPWQVLWLHSRFLSHRWDAPRELFPPEAEEAFDDMPNDDPVLLEDPGLANAETIQPPPFVFDSVVPPQLKLTARAHPDLITAWMRTYGCQIRLVDLLIEVLLQSIQVEDPCVVVVGTSGFSLGQNGWIGHHVGPLRSCDLRLPLIVSDHGPIRSPRVTSSESLTSLLHQLAGEPSTLLSPAQWCRSQDEFDNPLVTQSTRAQQAVTTAGWSFVRDPDAGEHLFLKPDDVDDVNDVGRLRHDVVSELTELGNGQDAST